MITGFENNHNMYLESRPMELQTVPRGVILPQKQAENGPMWGLGGVCDEHGDFVRLSAYDGGWASHGGGYPWQEETYLDCDVVYLGMFFNHWGHFLIDLMGRLWYFTRENTQRKPIKLAYLGGEEPQGNFLEVFSLLGIRQEDLLHITEPTRFRSVIVPEFSCKSCVWYSQEYRSIFDAMITRVAEEAYLPNHLKDTKKVYFSRLSFGKAKATEFGEEDIARWLEANGFTSVAPETLSVRDQIYLWNHAEEIACLDGSIPMSVAFSRNPQLKLTILHKTSLEHLNVELYLLMRPCQVYLLDAWFEPLKGYPKSIGAGPFLLHLGEDAKTYSLRRGWVFPFTERQLRCERNINCIKLVWRIANLDGKLRLLLSRLVPQTIKTTIRRFLSRGR